MGASGAVTKVDRWGRQSRIADGLASMANTPGNDSAIGPHGIMVLGSDTVFITNGGPTEPQDPAGNTILRETLAAQNPVANLFGKVLLIGPRGRPIPIVDIWDFERRVNPDAAIGNPAIDSNPVDLMLDGFRLVVADAGGNAVDVVDPRGRISALTVFGNRPVPNPFNPQAPPIQMQAVPTSVEEGPDHQYYVSQLTGFPFPVGGANVYKVNPRTGKQTVFARGFTNIMDLAFGRDGTLYVLEIDHDGLLGGSRGWRDLRRRPQGHAADRAPGGHAAGARRHHGRPRRPLRLDQRALARWRAGPAHPRDETRGARRQSLA